MYPFTNQFMKNQMDVLWYSNFPCLFNYMNYSNINNEQFSSFNHHIQNSWNSYYNDQTRNIVLNNLNHVAQSQMIYSSMLPLEAGRNDNVNSNIIGNLPLPSSLNSNKIQSSSTTSENHSFLQEAKPQEVINNIFYNEETMKDGKENNDLDDKEIIMEIEEKVLKKKKKRKMIRNLNCPHKGKKHYAKYMCSTCYHSSGRIKKSWNCSHIEEPHYALGLCLICYQTRYALMKKEKDEQKSQEKLDLTFSKM